MTRTTFGIKASNGIDTVSRSSLVFKPSLPTAFSLKADFTSADGGPATAMVWMRQPSLRLFSELVKERFGRVSTWLSTLAVRFLRGPWLSRQLLDKMKVLIFLVHVSFLC